MPISLFGQGGGGGGGGGTSSGSVSVKVITTASTGGDLLLATSGTTCAVDTSAGQVALTVTGAESFTVFDSASTFATNPCVITIGDDTYELNKSNKQYTFWLVGIIWRWSETTRETD